MGTYRISQLADISEVPATTLRFYETAGLLSAERTASGYRVYGDGAVERLAFISSATHLGLPLEEIGICSRSGISESVPRCVSGCFRWSPIGSPTSTTELSRRRISDCR
ncbi:MerR family transcriptional regulator [Rhodococcus jostii]|uniref:MerR HTH family regulatory protein n=1 Tax=Rhodococcus jostii TaxID=132919 RepID=A0A1H5MFE2_RHOJO|nr:MerR family transcriptional regulator [Rhodococcus jostii]SEE87873.1 MerR HTH family regulatory protein [Rhodococcus jostii]